MCGGGGGEVTVLSLMKLYTEEGLDSSSVWVVCSQYVSNFNVVYVIPGM